MFPTASLPANYSIFGIVQQKALAAAKVRARFFFY
jgi:hypothetical protein